MFTVRHIERNGYESLSQCKRLWRQTGPTPEDCGCDPGAVSTCLNTICPRRVAAFPMIAEQVDGTMLSFETGELFVMNENGRTVAKYEWRG